MKQARKIFGAFFGSILFGLGILNSSALTPIQHSGHGTIQDVDYANHQIVVREDGVERKFHWNESTLFKVAEPEADKAVLNRGEEIKFYYRREPGRLLLRQVTIKDNTNECSRCCASINNSSRSLE